MTQLHSGRVPRDRAAEGQFLHSVNLTTELIKPALEPVPIEEVRIITDYTPAVIGTGETTVLAVVLAGDTVIDVHARKVALTEVSGNSTLSIGDGNDLARFIDVVNTTTGAVGDRVNPQSENLPYTYSADDTIDVDYRVADSHGHTTRPRWEITIVLRLQPGGTYRGASHATHHR